MRDLTGRDANLPRISVGIVVYNGVEHIGAAIESVINQHYDNIELVVVDGASNDGTQQVLERYSGYLSTIVSEPDNGIYDAMNKVRLRASGDWLIFLGCDDVLLDGALSKIARCLKRSDAVYYGDVIFRSTGSFYGGSFSKYRLMHGNICHQAMFYPKTVYQAYAYGLDYRWLSDYAYNIRLIGDGVPLIHAGVVISLYNDKGGSSGGDSEFEKDKLRLIMTSFGVRYAALKILHDCWKDFERAVRALLKPVVYRIFRPTR